MGIIALIKTEEDLLCPRCHKCEVLKEFDYVENCGRADAVLKSDWAYITCKNCGWQKEGGLDD